MNVSRVGEKKLRPRPRRPKSFTGDGRERAACAAKRAMKLRRRRRRVGFRDRPNDVQVPRPLSHLRWQSTYHGVTEESYAGTCSQVQVCLTSFIFQRSLKTHLQRSKIIQIALHSSTACARPLFNLEVQSKYFFHSNYGDTCAGFMIVQGGQQSTAKSQVHRPAGTDEPSDGTQTPPTLRASDESPGTSTKSRQRSA